jgi:hypothetical protein
VDRSLNPERNEENMMFATSQIFVILGLIFEFISVLLTVRRLFCGYYKRLGKDTFRQEIRKDRIEGTLVLIFLTIGMVLQGIAVFLA